MVGQRHLRYVRAWEQSGANGVRRHSEVSDVRPAGKVLSQPVEVFRVSAEVFQLANKVLPGVLKVFRPAFGVLGLAREVLPGAKPFWAGRPP